MIAELVQFFGIIHSIFRNLLFWEICLGMVYELDSVGFACVKLLETH